MQEVHFNFWMFIAGLGIFLFGMYHLENGLKGLAGKSFKKLLQRFTNRSWKGVLTGAFVTAILQSSSLVTLLVVAFLGGGMISFQSSLGVVFGANLGTTVTAWLVATLGFKINVADLSFPFLAIGTLSYLLMDSRPVLKNLGSFLIGFGLLFLGLEFMKETIEEIALQIDLAEYGHVGLWIFLVAGMIFTALIQSSSAVIVIVLSALNAGLIDIYQSLALIIGANIGTTSTLLLASFRGTADKKRLAVANVIFNVTAGAITFALLRQLVLVTRQYLHIQEPLFEVVFLNSMINAIGILIFLPLIKPFGQFMSRRFQKAGPKGECLYIKNVTPEVPDIALKALDKELRHVFGLVNHFISDSLRASGNKKATWTNVFRVEVDPLAQYNHLKKLEDEITEFYTRLQKEQLSEAEAGQVTQYMSKLRSMIYSAKSIKDIIHNIKEIDQSEDELAHEILARLYKFAISSLQHLSSYDHSPEPVEMTRLLKDYGLFYNQTIDYFYKYLNAGMPREVTASSITNAIKKTVSALEHLTAAVPDHSDKEAIPDAGK